MSRKERVIVILLVLALVLSFISLTLHFVTPFEKGANASGGAPAGQVQLFVQKNVAGQTATPQGSG